MQISRRKLFPVAAAVAASGIPVSATPGTGASGAVGPILLERVCDHNKETYTAEEIRQIEIERPWWTWGCGTRFRWYFGSYPTCPNCGYQYYLSLEMLKSGKYNVELG